MKRKFILVVVLLFSALVEMKAQVIAYPFTGVGWLQRIRDYPTSHEFFVNLGGGLSYLRYKDGALGPGGNIGFGYAYAINGHWAVQTGAEYTYYTGKYDSPGVNGSYFIDNPHYYNKFKLSYSGAYKETQQVNYLNIPLMARFRLLVETRLPFVGNAKYLSRPASEDVFYFMMGPKFGIPISGSFVGNFQSVRIAGESLYTGQEHTDEIQHGYYESFKRGNKKEDLKLSYALSWSVEVGYELALNYALRASVGLYFDYGLLDIKNKDDHFIAIDYTMDESIENLNLGSILATSDKVTNVSAGVMFRLILNSKKTATMMNNPDARHISFFKDH